MTGHDTRGQAIWRQVLVTCLGAVMILALAASPAQAQDLDATAAEALFEQGRNLMKKGRFSEACDKFDASNKAEPSVGALLNLGECRRKNGQPASAWTVFRQAEAMARRTGDRKRARSARRRAKKLEKELSYLTIQVPSEIRADGMSVTRDGALVNEALWDQKVPVDPGTYVIRIEAPGHETKEIRIEVPKKRDDIQITAPALSKKSTPEPPDTTPDPTGDTTDSGDGTSSGTQIDVSTGDSGAGSASGDLAERITPTSPRSGAMRDASSGLPTGRKIALASGAVGIAALATGAVFGLQASSKWDDAKSMCANGTTACTPEAVTLGDDAQSRANLATATFAVGVAATGAAVALWLFSSPSERASSTATGPGRASNERVATIHPILGADVAGLGVSLRW